MEEEANTEDAAGQEAAKNGEGAPVPQKGIFRELGGRHQLQHYDLLTLENNDSSCNGRTKQNLLLIYKTNSTKKAELHVRFLGVCQMKLCGGLHVLYIGC